MADDMIRIGLREIAQAVRRAARHVRFGADGALLHMFVWVAAYTWAQCAIRSVDRYAAVRSFRDAQVQREILAMALGLEI